MKLSERIKQIRKEKGLTQEELAKKMELTRATIINWEKGVTYPDGKEIKILSKVLDNDLTLLHVEHGMSKVSEKQIPFYDAVAVGGASMLAEQDAKYQPTEMIDPGTWFKSASGALRVYGHSMFPKYPAGSIIAFKSADMEVIIWGEDYIIELEDRRIVKRIDKCDIPDCVKAVSYNKSEEYVYAPIEIPKHKIKRLYMVLGKVELEASI